GVAFFGIGQLLYAGTFAAIARSRGHTPSAGPDGWYMLVLLPVFWTAALAFHRAPRAEHFLVAAGVFLVCEWRLTLGLLPGVYSGALLPNGANAHFTAYVALLSPPVSALRVFPTVALSPGLAVPAAPAAWFCAAAAAFFLRVGVSGRRGGRSGGEDRLLRG